MAKKALSARAKKAWQTRRANAARTSISLVDWNKLQVGPSEPVELSLCQQLEETITRFENRISNSIGRLNELIGKI